MSRRIFAINRPAASVVTADGGTVEMAPTVGNYFMPIGMGGLGFDFQPRMKAPISLFVRGGGYMYYVIREGEVIIFGGVVIDYEFGGFCRCSDGNEFGVGCFEFVASETLAAWRAARVTKNIGVDE